MKAAQINAYGGADVIEINDSAEKPSPKDEQVLVEVHASSVNTIDGKIRASSLQQFLKLQFPVTLGGDIAGVVAEVGNGVSDVAAGDKVYGQASVFREGSGALAEFAATKADQIAKMPSNINFEEAAALPLTGVSALQALEQHIQLQKGQKILIHGGAGGIGSIAIQIAKHIGAYVATTASAESKQFVTELGADEVIDYKSQKFEDIIKDFDAVFDTVGGETNKKSYQVLKKGGILVSMGEQTDQALERQYDVTAITQMTHVSTEALEKLAKLVEEGIVKTLIDKTFPLEQTQEAFTTQEDGGVKGKVVITIK
jgi:alcohol dehydrogenase